MKMKRLLVYLSLIALVQMLFVPCAGKFIDEIISRHPRDPTFMIASYTMSMGLIVVGWNLYLKLFRKTKRNIK
jgi:hypothetical protein